MNRTLMFFDAGISILSRMQESS